MIIANDSSRGNKWLKAYSQQNQESYILLLLNIALLVLVPRVFAMTVCDSYTASSRMIIRALQQNHIKEYTYTQKVNSRQHKTTSYGITPIGLKFLTDNYKLIPEPYQWITDVDLSKDISRIKSTTFRSDYMERFLNINGSAFVASMAGIEINPIFVDRGEEQEQSLNKIIKAAWERKQGTEPQVLLYKNAYEIKRQLKEITGEQNSFVAGRYTGIVESPSKTALVYVGSRNGMAWSKKATMPETRAHHAYDTHLSQYRTLRGGENHGIMFVESPKMFADLMLDKANKRKGEPFANCFDSFLIFPVSYVGTSQFITYMVTDHKAFEVNLAKEAVESGIYQNNTKGFYPELFPLVHENDIPMAVGVYMDIIKMNRIEKIAKKANHPYGIICFPWQVEYYRRVYFESIFMTVK